MATSVLVELKLHFVVEYTALSVSLFSSWSKMMFHICSLSPSQEEEGARVSRARSLVSLVPCQQRNVDTELLQL